MKTNEPQYYVVTDAEYSRIYNRRKPCRTNQTGHACEAIMQDKDKAEAWAELWNKFGATHEKPQRGRGQAAVDCLGQ